MLSVQEAKVSQSEQRSLCHHSLAHITTISLWEKPWVVSHLSQEEQAGRAEGPAERAPGALGAASWDPHPISAPLAPTASPSGNWLLWFPMAKYANLK